MVNKLGQNNEWIWKRKGAYRVLSLMKEGKSIPEIAREVKWKEETVWNFISSTSFLRKFDVYLKSVFFEFQKNKVLAIEEVSKLFWDVVMGRKIVEGLTPEKASRHLIKLLKIQEDPKISNPINIISNISKAPDSKEPKDLAEEFGFEGLQLREEEKVELDS